MEATQPKKGFSGVSFFIGLLIGVGITFVILKPDNSFVLSTNIKDQKDKPTGLLAPIVDPIIEQPAQEEKRSYDLWDTFLPKVQSVTSALFAKQKITIGELSLANMPQILDLNGDGTSEVLIKIQKDPSALGFITILSRNEDIVTPIKIKSEKGQSGDFVASVGTNNKTVFDFKLLPDDKSFYTSSIVRDDTGAATTCTFKFYRWNDKTKLFEYNKLLSDVAKQDNCK